MKIIFDCRYTRLERHDGISRYGARLVEELAKLHPVTMLIQDERQLSMLPDLPWVIGPPVTGATEPFVALTVNRYEPDVVFTPMQTMGPGFRRYALVTSVHDLIYFTHRTPPRNLPAAVRVIWRIYHLWWGFQRALLNRADATVVDSETTRSLIIAHRLTRKPVHVLLLGTEHPESLPQRRAPERRDLIYMGSFMPYKNVDLIVSAMAWLPEYRLILMSRITDRERARLAKLVGTGTVVFRNGATDEEYSEALRGATALVSASRDEGFGLPVAEAQALGTPVLLSDTPIFREIGGAASGFFDPDDVQSLVSAVRELEDDAEWAKRSAESARWALRYNWPDAAAVLLDLLTETVRQRKALTR